MYPARKDGSLINGVQRWKLTVPVEKLRQKPGAVFSGMKDNKDRGRQVRGQIRENRVQRP